MFAEPSLPQPFKRKRRSDYKGKKPRRSTRDWEFIAWDGEGLAVDEPRRLGPIHYRNGPNGDRKGREILLDYTPESQPYVLLANSKLNHIATREGLNTRDCLDLILDTKRQHPKSIFVGFGFNYDVNQILRDLSPHCLWKLHDSNETRFGGYYLKWFPRKSFYVKHRRSGRSAIIYDVFGFFQTSFLKVCEEYLGEDDPDLGLIKEGKAGRSGFEWEQMDDFILPYNRMELNMLVRVMDIFREDLGSTSIYPGQWHGPGAVAGAALKKYGVKVSRDIPKEVQDASQYAYAGGRFEQFRVGRYDSHVVEYDIHSAYPEAASKLPNLTEGTWHHVKSYEPGTFGVWSVNRRSPNGSQDNGPQPLFCRSEGGFISYPREVSGWYWSPEAELVAGDIQEGWVFRPDDTEQAASSSRPFEFVADLYDQRRILKSQGSSTQRAIKLILNSIYGKLAQTIGGKDKPPAWHQLEWAGYITSYTRAKIYRAIMQNPGAIIAAETDAVFSTVPLDLDEGPELGQWERKEYDSITYIQSGFYYATQGDKVVVKYRGMDKDPATGQPLGLPYPLVLDHLRTKTGIKGQWHTPPLHAYTTRFVGLGLGLRTDAVWRSWEQEEKVVAIDQDPENGKRVHLPGACSQCQQGVSMYDSMHPLVIGGYEGESYARSLPWRQLDYEADVEDVEWKEMNPDARDYFEDSERWE